MARKKRKGEDNLIPISERSSEEVREMGRKGGIKSGKVRKAKRDMRNMLNDYLSQPITDKKQIQAMKEHGFGRTEDGEEVELTEQDVFVLKVVEGYRKGDYRYLDMVLKMVGGYAETKNVTKLEGSVNIENSVEKIEEYLKEGESEEEPEDES